MFLQQDAAKRIVIGQLGSRLAKRTGLCLGFVIMPDHVHALIWFPQIEQLCSFMDEWKTQSSHAIKTLYRTRFPNDWRELDQSAPVWQARDDDIKI